MRLSFKYDVSKISNVQKEIINDIMWHTTKVYNILLHELREKEKQININKSINIISSPIYKEYRQNNWHSEYLHSHTLQQVIINVVQNYKSYLKSIEEYKKNKTKFKGEPREPRYKGVNIQEIIITKYGVRKEKNILKLSLSKKMQEKYKVKSLNFSIPYELKKLVNFKSIKMIRITKRGEKIEMNIVYDKKEKAKSKYENIMSIDLGLNNIVACTNRDNNDSLLVSGKEAKSKNKYILNEISKLQRINKLSKENKNKKHVPNTKRINKLYEYRRNYMNTYMHKVSKMVIEYAKKNKCSKIVIGDLKDIKQGMKYNTNFVQVPIQILTQKIEYKAKLEGIEVKKISEKYTSGVSAIDKEEITKENYKKKRRISRGIFETNNGKKINADINGSLNILRKYIKISNPNLEIAMDNGREQRPIKKRVA